MKKIRYSFLFFWFFAAQIQAAEMSSTVSQNLEPAYLIGDSDLNFLGLKVYHLALWSEAQKFSYDKKFAIQIRYNMNFSKEDLAKKSIEEIERLHVLSAQDKENFLAELKKIFSSVKKGDEKVAIFTPNQGVEMFYNGKLNGKISDQKLARLFVDIWLDERGSYPKVTKKILGKKI
ncbi:MAG: chalcone isomerase family protein [Proteobacteria bacterium]|nr:chalcone isomerase family protein [Pseudomonadota bacterium]